MEEKVLASMTAPALREYIRSILSKKGKPRTDKESDEADKEREALSDLHAEKSGKPPVIEVTDEDLPFNDDEEPESDDEAEGESPVKKKKKPSKDE